VITIKTLKQDIPASIVVVFVAIPLCLGIALASGAPLFAGIIAGIIGGIVVGFISNSQLGVSGPAAGLAVIVYDSVETLGGAWPAFLTVIVIAGIMQILLGLIKAGFIAYFFPSSVINGMLTGIGLLIIIKQLPQATGTINAEITPKTYLNLINKGAVLITLVSLIILIVWDKFLFKKSKIFTLLNGPLVAVICGIIINILFINNLLPFKLNQNQLVNLPVINNFSEFASLFTTPDFSILTNFKVWEIAIVVAIVASLETLLSVEATDKLDPQKRITSANRELIAQGTGNIVSGLVGGLPITQVIVRSSANISFGGQTKASTILHGFIVLLCALFIPNILNLLPLATLASILFVVGYKLAEPKLFLKMLNNGRDQFVPFIVTVIVIIIDDLLIGVLAGLITGSFFVLWKSYKNSHIVKEFVSLENGVKTYHFKLAEEMPFFNKASIVKELNGVPKNARVIIDCSKSVYIDYDIKEFIQDFINNAPSKNIVVEAINFNKNNL